MCTASPYASIRWALHLMHVHSMYFSYSFVFNCRLLFWRWSHGRADLRDDKQSAGGDGEGIVGEQTVTASLYNSREVKPWPGDSPLATNLSGPTSPRLVTPRRIVLSSDDAQRPEDTQRKMHLKTESKLMAKEMVANAGTFDQVLGSDKNCLVCACGR